jgi:alkanesulfonate monooxygenase SsuD/methylene tetrahydromethanopterin reductase-like flavin-dependent oxidoreductase (luciferase family)
MNGHRPFRFGVMGNASPEAWVEHVRQAEDLGYNTLSLGEHIFASLAPLSALTAAAMCISTIRLGSLTFANDFRNPVLLAKEVATLDALSGGRFEFGLGSGFARADYAGSHYTVTGLSLTPTLPRRPPILIGGGGRRGHHRR